jgi:cobalt-zinc-cadmium efflux system membrane fusion protein
MRPFWLLLPLVWLGCASSCSKNEPEHKDEPNENEGLDFRNHQESLKYVTIEGVKMVTIRPSLNLPGKIAFDEDHTQRIASPIDGRVHAVLHKLGDKVKPGQALIELTSPQVAQLESDLRKAEEDSQVAKKSLERAKALQADGAVSAKEFAQIEADQRKSEAEVARVRSQLGVLGISDHASIIASIASQVTGAVVDRNVLPGQEVRADAAQALMTVSDLSTVWALADVYEADVALVDPGDPAEVKVPAYPDDIFKGQVAYVGEVVDPTSRTVKVRMSIANAEMKLKPDMFANVKIDAAEDLKCITVPTAAVLTNGDRSEVVAASADKPDVFKLRPVKIGSEMDGNVRIYEGLKEGDRIITKGALFMKQEIRDQ